MSQIIINVEAQKDEPKGYEILNRAIFYVSRLISSQKERDFENSSYDDIKRVYSIWVCMNMEESSMSHVHLTKEDLIGSYQWKGNLDLLNIIMLGLAKNLPEHDETYELHRLLCALLSQELTIDEKLNIIGNEYDIPIEENFRKDVSVMCNLSQGIEEKGIAIGEARKEEKINLNEILKDESYKLGTFRRNGKGFGFVNVGEEDEIFISPKLTKNALDGDEVLIRIFDDNEAQMVSIREKVKYFKLRNMHRTQLLEFIRRVEILAL